MSRQQRQIETLLAAFGLQDVDIAVDGEDQSSSSVMDTTDAAEATSLPATQPVNSTYAAASKKPPITQPALVKKFTNAMVSAVYRDLGDKERRASNIVVNGLPSSGDDKSSVTQLIAEEFNTTPTVIKCRRLGKQLPGKTQPLLVVLGCSAEASSVVSRAKVLRHSIHSRVRQHVYISADVTKAEAHAAYQKRCERRERASKQLTQTGSAGLNASAEHFIPTSAPVASSSSSASVTVAVIAPSTLDGSSNSM